MENSLLEAKKQGSLLDENNVRKYLGVGVACMIVGFALIPIIVTQIYGGVIYGERTGQIGDTIGGIMGPIVGSIGAALSFLAFWAQYQANQKQSLALADQLEFNKAQTAALVHQKNAADEQIKTMQVERFESRLFAMLETHRNNVSETKVHYAFKSRLGDDLEICAFQGRMAFDMLAFEFRHLHEGIIKPIKKDLQEQHKALGIDWERLHFEVAFAIFYYGVTLTSNKIPNTYWASNEDSLFKKSKQFIIEYRKSALAKMATGALSTPLGTFFAEDLGYDQHHRAPIPLPTAGHSYLLSHYFRHLFSMVEYIDQSSETVVSADKRQQYAMMVRAQLSIPEQHLLYYYSLSKIGKLWIDKEYLTKYTLLKNMHFPIVSFYLDPIEALGIEPENAHNHFGWVTLQNNL